MENQDPATKPNKLGKLDNRKRIQAKNLSLRSQVTIIKQDSQSLAEEPEDSAHYSKANQNIHVAESSLGTANLKNSKDVMLTDNNDSLCDFRSPIKDNEMNESLADFKVKPTILKSNKRPGRKESKSVVSKKRGNRDAPLNINQPSIESSFFKPQTTIKTAFLCPLCFKSYKDSTTQHNHMKSCAAKNKISTNKLLDAVKLQEKQANERKAMGLLAAPPIQEAKKTMSRKLISEKDPQLQLALALSMSLHEAQVSEEFEEAHLLAGEPCLPINTAMTDERRETLQNFGFTTNKPATASTSGKSRKKRPTGPTALQTRTQEERDRLTTVRIAEVLMGDEAITQAMLNNVDKVIKSEENIVLRSRLLRSYHKVKDRLWEKTQQCLTDPGSYSCNLVEVSPCKVKPEPEIKQTESGPSKLETPNQQAKNSPDKLETNNAAAAIKLETASTSAIINNKKEPIVKQKVDSNSLMNLSEDWGRMLDSSYMSDVMIMVKNNDHINAHRVVFFARCYEILSDVIDQEPDHIWHKKERILWPETDPLSARAFLEYIYCGVIDLYSSVFYDPDILAGVRVLARKYRLKKLFAYLKDKSKELKSNKVDISKAGLNLESNYSAVDPSSISEEEGSICSAETDINSVSTACNENTSNNPIDEEPNDNSDNKLARNNVESLSLQERDNVSNSSIVDCFSSSNDSLPIQIPTTSSTKTIHEKLLDKELTERSFTGVDNDADIQNLRRSTFLPVQNNNTNLRIVNNTFDEDRCISPDIFDDSTNASSPYVYTMADKHVEHNANCSAADIEVVSTSGKDLQTESFDLEGEIDRAVDLPQENIRGRSERSMADCPFVSTRRRGRSSRDLESENLNQEKKISGLVSREKGDITLAIEKIQRLNAKTASESDSDCESFETFQTKKHKNPFRLNQTGNSSSIEEIVKDDLLFESDNEIPLKRRNKLSIFEKKIEIEAAKNPAMFNLTPKKAKLKSRTNSIELQDDKLGQQNDEIEIEDRIEPSQIKTLRQDDTADTIFDLTQESSRESKPYSDAEEVCSVANTEDKDLSMFEKYKRSHRVNSIDKYRAALKSSVSSIKDTDEALFSDVSLSSGDELFNSTNSEVKRNSFSSKYEYTDPNQSTSHVHRELSNIFSKGEKKQIDVSLESLSHKPDDEEQSAVKLDDDELSDLEIDLSEFSTSKSFQRFSESSTGSKSQRPSTSRRKSGNRSFDDIKRIDSFSDSKLQDTEFTVMKNDCGNNKSNISDQDTDVECHMESISSLKQFRTEYAEKSSDIYNEETDPGENEEKTYRSKYSSSKKKLDTVLDTVSKEIPNSQSLDKEVCEISSPECEISGIFSPPAKNFDSFSNLTNEVDDLFQECRESRQSYRKSQMNLDNFSPRATTSESIAKSALTPRIPINDLDHDNLLNGISDSEFDDIEFRVNRASSKTNLALGKSTDVVQGEKMNNKKTEEDFYILDSDSSDNGSPNIHRIKSSGSISMSNKSKAIKKRSIQSKRQSISPEKKSRSSLRTFTAKSVSENIIKSRSKSRSSFILDDSFDGELARVQTPPIPEQNTRSCNAQITPSQGAPSENVTPLANYSAMKTPELRKELQKYGLKAQKRHRAKRLLRYIYDELHPFIPVEDKNVALHSSESSSEDESPPLKRLNKSHSLEAINTWKNTDNLDSDCETLASDVRRLSDASNDNEEFENNDLYNKCQYDNPQGLENVFRNLLEADKSLHNKVLTYEPLVLEELHSMLKAQGTKCNLNSLMDFLDEQSITFRTMANGKRNRTKRNASPKKNQSTQ